MKGDKITDKYAVAGREGKIAAGLGAGAGGAAAIILRIFGGF